MPYLKIETTFVDGIKYLLETHDTQLAAANEKTIKFYDFIDKNDKENKQREIKDKTELQTQMKNIFLSYDKEKTLKLKKEDIKKYLEQLSTEIGLDDFKAASKCSVEAFDDIWHKFGCNDTGTMSLHHIKPMIKSLIDHEK